MINTQPTELTLWLRRLTHHPVAIMSKQEDIEQAVEQGTLRDYLRQDPLLAMRLFQTAKHLPKGAPLQNSQDLIDLLGAKQVAALAAKMDRLDASHPLHQGLIRAIGDAQLACALLELWFRARHIEFTDTDYWQTLFDAAPLFAMWWSDPLVMEGLDQQTDRQPLQRRLAMRLECRYLQVLEAIQQHWELPVAVHLANSQHPKAGAMKFFLPFSHELAHCARHSWQSDAFFEVCRRGGIALGINQFVEQLRRWLLDIGRQQPESLANTALRHYLANQPYDAPVIARQPAANQQIDQQAINELALSMHPKHLAFIDRVDLYDGLLSGLQNHLHSNACFILTAQATQLHTVAWRNLSTPMPTQPSNPIFTKLRQQSVSLWINQRNRQQTSPHFSNDWHALIGKQEVMMRSVCYHGSCQAIIVAIFDQASHEQYVSFRKLATAFGKALLITH